MYDAVLLFVRYCNSVNIAVFCNIYDKGKRCLYISEILCKTVCDGRIMTRTPGNIVSGRTKGIIYIYITFIHLADAFIQSDLQLRNIY